MTEQLRRRTGAGTPTRRRFLALAGTGLAATAAGCFTTSTGEQTATPSEATATIRLRNHDDVDRSYEVVVRHGDTLVNRMEGVLPADLEEYVEMVATFRATDAQHEFSINTEGGQRGQTWDPTECPDFLVNSYVEDGEPGFETECRG